jgi:hypothetical protein
VHVLGFVFELTSRVKVIARGAVPVIVHTNILAQAHWQPAK